MEVKRERERLKKGEMLGEDRERGFSGIKVISASK
jgi:hypothetical protein